MKVISLRKFGPPKVAKKLGCSVPMWYIGWLCMIVGLVSGSVVVLRELMGSC